MKHRKTIASLMMFAVAAGAALLTAALAVGVIEARSQKEVARVLALTGHDWVRVEADGLRIVLTGEAKDEANRFSALREAASIVDSARLADEITIHRPEPITPPEFSIEILQNDDGISLIGLVPLTTDIEDVATRIAENSGGQPVSELVDQADYPAPAQWDLSVDYAILALTVLDRSKISVAPRRVDIVASVESAQQKRQLDTQLRAAAPAGVEVSVQIAAPRPVVTPYTLRFVLDDRGARFDACTTDTDNGVAMILAAAIAAGMEGPQKCTVALGVPSPDWDDAVIMSIIALDDIGKGTVTFSDADITFTGVHDTDPVLFDRISGELKANLPPSFSLTALLPDPPQQFGTDVQAGPPVFTATLSPEGLLGLRGPMPDERARQTAQSIARAAFSGDAVTDAIRLREDLPLRWSLRVFAGLSALSQLQNGLLEIDPDHISLRGNTGDLDGQANIAAFLADRLDPSSSYSIDITYQESLDPLASIPTPEECVSRINAILADRQITFAPSSADIDDEGRKAIADIVEIMAECEHATMEIAGHTDSQGREIMNKELSQARANAVIDALLARRVLTSNLTAIGYGEEQPIADNETEEGREANRRIEFRLIEKTEDPAEEDATAETAEPEAVPDSEAAENGATEADAGQNDITDPEPEPAAQPESDGAPQGPEQESDG
jgi:OOP family OmpA-OmpF porin